MNSTAEEQRLFRLLVTHHSSLITETHMTRIVHLALKVKDLEKATAFYQDVFGLREVNTHKHSDHVSRHMTDGAFDFTLMKYDENVESVERDAAGVNPCIHHFALEVDDIEKSTAELT